MGLFFYQYFAPNGAFGRSENGFWFLNIKIPGWLMAYYFWILE